MRYARWFGRTAALTLSATLLLATACTSSVNDTWHLRAKKGTAAVGERVTLLPAEKQINSGCAGINSESRIVMPQDLDWTVTPSTGRVVADYFVADAPGTYKLAPVVTADSGVPGMTPGRPLGPTMTIKVVPGETPSTETTGAEIQASMDTPEPSADAPLAGTWSYVGMKVTGTGSGATWARAPKPGTLVIEKRTDGYYLQISEGTSKATLDGTSVVLERDFPNLGVSVRYTGVLNGDTITGTQHTVANGATHDDPWTATRVR
ncbi:MAG: hypothetical protein Q7W16_07780 [Coriobacteriia bacterium]|nr:hypothetical protein [Coriobacteriia bacterium]